MAVTVKIKRASAAKRNGAREYTRVLILRSDTDLSEEEVGDLPEVPSRGDPHPGDVGAKASEVTCEQEAEGDLRNWRVTVKWTTDSRFTQPENPMLRLPELSRQAIRGSVPYFLDETPETDGGPKPVMNSAGEAFDDFPTRDVVYSGYIFTRNESAASYASRGALALENTINSADVTLWGVGTLPARTARLVSVEPTLVQEGGATYWRVTYTIETRPEAGDWDDEILDRGYTALDPTNQRYRILDANGEPVTKPYPLNGAGGEQGSPTDPGMTLTFRPYREASWAGLSLGTIS